MGEALRTTVKAPETKKENLVSQLQKGNFYKPVSSPVEQILLLQRTIGNQAVQKLMKSGALQAKLRIDAPGDVYEQEADRVESQINSLRGGGQPLPESVSTFFELRFGTDFSRVRVHSGRAAEQSARDVNANAYTVGHDIVFGAGQFAPQVNEGRRLLAHELTHVIQQSENTTLGVQRNIAADVLTTQITSAQSEEMTDSELDQEIQRLRSHLGTLDRTSPDYMGASENLHILESVALGRHDSPRVLRQEHHSPEPAVPEGYLDRLFIALEASGDNIVDGFFWGLFAIVALVVVGAAIIPEGIVAAATAVLASYTIAGVSLGAWLTALGLSYAAHELFAAYLDLDAVLRQRHPTRAHIEAAGRTWGERTGLALSFFIPVIMGAAGRLMYQAERGLVESLSRGRVVVPRSVPAVPPRPLPVTVAGASETEAVAVAPRAPIVETPAVAEPPVATPRTSMPSQVSSEPEAPPVSATTRAPRPIRHGFTARMRARMRASLLAATMRSMGEVLPNPGGTGASIGVGGERAPRFGVVEEASVVASEVYVGPRAPVVEAPAPVIETPAVAEPPVATPRASMPSQVSSGPEAPPVSATARTPRPFTTLTADPYTSLSMQQLRNQVRAGDPMAIEALWLRYDSMTDSQLAQQRDPMAETQYAGRTVVHPSAIGQGRFSRSDIQERLEADIRGARNSSGIPRRTRTAVEPEVRRTTGGTIGVARTDSPELEGRQPFVGRSILAGGTPNPDTEFPPTTDRAVLPHTHDHVEQDIADQFAAALRALGIPPDQVNELLHGRTIWMLIEQEPCSACAEGIAHPELSDTEVGVLMRFSRSFPTLTIQVKDVLSSALITLRGGIRR